jgi:hypothetical protein
LGIEAGTITPTPVFIILEHLNVGRPLLSINIVDIIFSSVLIMKSKNKNMKLDLTNYLKICKIHLYISIDWETMSLGWIYASQ